MYLWWRRWWANCCPMEFEDLQRVLSEFIGLPLQRHRRGHRKWLERIRRRQVWLIAHHHHQHHSGCRLQRVWCVGVAFSFLIKSMHLRNPCVLIPGNWWENALDIGFGRHANFFLHGICCNGLLTYFWLLWLTFVLSVGNEILILSSMSQNRCPFMPSWPRDWILWDEANYLMKPHDSQFTIKRKCDMKWGQEEDRHSMMLTVYRVARIPRCKHCDRAWNVLTRKPSHLMPRAIKLWCFTGCMT